MAPRDRVREAAAVAGELVPDDTAGEAAMRAALAGRYRVVRRSWCCWPRRLPGRRSLRWCAACRARRVRGSARLPAPRSTLPWCRRCGAARCTATGIFPPGRWTGMPTCCASWSSCVPRCAAVTCSPRRRCGGPCGRCCWTARRGRRSGRRSPPGLRLAGPAGEHLRDLARSLDAAWRCLGAWRRLTPRGWRTTRQHFYMRNESPRRSAEFAHARPLVFRLCFSSARRRSPGRS